MGIEIENFIASLAKNTKLDAMIASFDNLVNVFTKLGGISSQFREFSSAFKDFNSTMGSFASNIHKFGINFAKVVPNLGRYEKFAAVLNGQAYYGPRFAIFEPAFGKMSADLGIFSKNFKNMDTTAIQAFSIWTQALTDFVKIDPKTFSTIADQLEKVINAPLSAQDAIDRKNQPNTPPNSSSVPLLQDAKPAARITSEVVDRHGKADKEREKAERADEMNELKQTMAMMVQQMNRLVNALTDSNGLPVHIVS